MVDAVHVNALPDIDLRPIGTASSAAAKPFPTVGQPFRIPLYAPVTDVEVIDSLTAVAHFEQPNPLWFDIFSGTNHGYAYPKHLLEADAAALDKFRLAPIGTGPFVGDSFSVNDQVIYKANDTYREPTKPYFSSILLKGGGDAPSAARAVLQTGDYDFVTNLNIEREVLNDMISDNGPGVLVTSPGTGVERIDLNHSDPWTEVDGQRDRQGDHCERLLPR